MILMVIFVIFGLIVPSEKQEEVIQEEVIQENEVYLRILDAQLGGVIDFYRQFDDPESLEAVRLWDEGVRVVNIEDFERKIVPGKGWLVVYKGTNDRVRGEEVVLNTQFPESEVLEEEVEILPIGKEISSPNKTVENFLIARKTQDFKKENSFLTQEFKTSGMILSYDKDLIPINWCRFQIEEENYKNDSKKSIDGKEYVVFVRVYEGCETEKEMYSSVRFYVIKNNIGFFVDYISGHEVGGDIVMSEYTPFIIKLERRSDLILESLGEYKYNFVPRFLTEIFNLSSSMVRQDVTERWGKDQFDSSYYVLFPISKQIDTTKTYGDVNVSIKISPLENRVIPYINDPGYCEVDNDCLIRNDFCGYGAYNKFGFVPGVETGCEGFFEQTYEQENLVSLYEYDDTCIESHPGVKYQSTKCVLNQCLALNRTITCVPGEIP